ncbi:MAG: hypothetical protein LKG27_07280 [Clostridiaceae bacterium]|jgi:hypothetical protein|nr:hypothetical protein [Clostridiaceae bacterium]
MPIGSITSFDTRYMLQRTDNVATLDNDNKTAEKSENQKSVEIPKTPVAQETQVKKASATNAIWAYATAALGLAGCGIYYYKKHKTPKKTTPKYTDKVYYKNDVKEITKWTKDKSGKLVQKVLERFVYESNRTVHTNYRTGNLIIETVTPKTDKKFYIIERSYKTLDGKLKRKEFIAPDGGLIHYGIFDKSGNEIKHYYLTMNNAILYEKNAKNFVPDELKSKVKLEGTEFPYTVIGERKYYNIGKDDCYYILKYKDMTNTDGTDKYIYEKHLTKDNTLLGHVVFDEKTGKNIMKPEK